MTNYLTTNYPSLMPKRLTPPVKEHFHNKMLPHNLDAEESLLSAMMIDNSTLSDIIQIISPEDFFRPQHQKIFSVIIELFKEEKPADLVTVANVLREKGEIEEVGGSTYLSYLMDAVPLAIHAPHYAKIVHDKARLRRLIERSGDIARRCFEHQGNVDEVIDFAERAIFEITESKGKQPISQIGKIVDDNVRLLENLKGNQKKVTGVPTGYYKFDEITSGLQKSDLIILAARPAMGKCLGKGTKVLMYSGELKNVEDVRVGDKLMGDDGTPRKVLSLASGKEKMYWIKQNKGIDYRVNASHILSLKKIKNGYQYNKSNILNISVEEYQKQSERLKSDYKGYKVSLSFKEQPLEIEPYAFGIKIGNGKNKYIPQNYLINTEQNRLLLLAGLIDSFGEYHKKANIYQITQKDEKLVREIKFLCDTLGFRTSLKKKKAFTSNYFFRVRFSGDIEKIPVKIAQKKARKWEYGKSWKETNIKVVFDKVDDYYGFTLDKNGLFLLEDMTVTHNTAFALNIARNAAADAEVPVAFFSLEMSKEQLAMRMLCAEARINLTRLRTGFFSDDEWHKITDAASTFDELPIFIDDSADISELEIRAKSRKLKMEKDIGLIIIDYLQLMKSHSSVERRELEIAEISRSLKKLAKELNIPVIALSQLNRKVEERGDKRPLLSDLRESGSLEQDADIVTFLFREAVYNKTHKDENGNPIPDPQIASKAEVIVAKHRNGAVGTVNLNFTSKYLRFDNPAPDHMVGY